SRSSFAPIRSTPPPGGLTETVTDAALPGPGEPVVLRRTYNSPDPTTGVLGAGWTPEYAASLTIAGSGDVPYRAASGQQLVLPKQPDGTFAPPGGMLSSFAEQGDGSYLLETPGGVAYRFAATGELTSISPRNRPALREIAEQLLLDAHGGKRSFGTW